MTDRKSAQCSASKVICILEQEKRENRDEDEPGEIAPECEQACQRVTQRTFQRLRRSLNHLVDRVANRRRKRIWIHNESPRLQTVTRSGHVRWGLLPKQRDLGAQLRNQERR